VGSPQGLRGLFPSNKVRFAVKKRPTPVLLQEAQG
jgi:hypothetical protein